MSRPLDKRVRVLIVDDSALVRKILADGLSRDHGIEVVGTAADPYKARDLIVELKPDVITLDVEMPRMDGVTFLKRLMPVLPTPTVMISSLTEQGKRISYEALEAGAVDVITKPALGVADNLPAMLSDICARVKAAAKVDVSRMRRVSEAAPPPPATSLDETTDRIIAIGASTGGVQALGRIMPAFPANAPGVVIVQHMPGGITASFAERLNASCAMRIKEAEHGDRLLPGLALIAPGGPRHMAVTRSGGQYRVILKEGPLVNYSRPAVDVLFRSVAEAAGRNAAAAVLTGMGRDGAAGLAAIKAAGGSTFAQDEDSSIVFGMPKAAIDIGAAQQVAPLHMMPSLLVRAVAGR
jgi:two-component system, chemotaxis family, protein-glutamate methylesterase/glutaminase